MARMSPIPLPSEPRMYPFDPAWTFEELVANINAEHRPGSLTSGKTRNVMLHAWALHVGRQRAASEFADAVTRHGSRAALARWMQISPQTLKEFEAYVHGLKESKTLPLTLQGLHDALTALTPDEQEAFAALVGSLVAEPALLARLSQSIAARGAAQLLQVALRGAEMRAAIEELEQLLNSGTSEESAYQRWCDQHSWAFGGAHRVRDDVRAIDSASIADLLLPDVSGYRDIVELKRPDAPVLRYDRSHQTYYFSSDCAKAIAQVSKYMERLHDLAREGLERHPEIVAYYPRATIIIGRSQQWNKVETEALRRLSERLHGIVIITYDYLLARASILLENLERQMRPSVVAAP